MTKMCRGCRETKPVGEFYRHPQMSDGRLNHCKACKRKYAKDRHHEMMQDPGWRERERERGRTRDHKPATNGTIRRRARTAVSNAVRDGRMTPADACEDCGHDYRHHRREAHHEDYMKPLEVEWLCSLCHGRRHRNG
jgi:uncharacterized protein with PIN domain